MGIGEQFEFERTGRIDPEPGTLQDRVQDHVFQTSIALTAVKDMLLGADAADRSNKTLCRAVKRLLARARGRAETIRRLESALDEYEQFADRQAKIIRELGDPEVLEMHYTPGKLDVTMRSKLITLFADTMAETLDAEGAENLVEWTVNHPEKGPLTLTLQRQFGKTPMKLYAEARADADRYKTVVDGLHRAQPQNEWNEEIGNVLWWRWPVCEPPFCGCPWDSDWPFEDDDEVRWTPIVEPDPDTEPPVADQTSIL